MKIEVSIGKIVAKLTILEKMKEPFKAPVLLSSAVIDCGLLSAALKKQINLKYSSELIEEKEYVKYR